MAAAPDRLFKAFADPTRLRILYLLRARGELCVCDLMRVLRAPQSTVSRHLSYLKRAGLVKDRRQGLWSHYSLAKPVGVLHARLIACVGGCLGGLPDMKKDLRVLR